MRGCEGGLSVGGVEMAVMLEEFEVEGSCEAGGVGKGGQVFEVGEE